MIKPDMIPDDVVEAMARNRAIRNEDDDRYWPDYADGVEADLLAGLNAWPQMHLHEWQRPWLGGMSGADIILPMPEAPQGHIAKQKEADDEAVP